MEISAQLVTCVVYANLLLYTFFVGSLCSKVSEQKQNEIAVSSEVNVHRGPELMERAGAQIYWPHQHWWGKKKHKPKRKPPSKRKPPPKVIHKHKPPPKKWHPPKNHPQNIPGFNHKFDHPLSIVCDRTKGEGLFKVRSKYDGYYKDRVWDWKCHKVVSNPLTECSWSPDINNWKQDISFMCPKNKFMAGIKSHHKNGIEDRRWRIRCCSARDRHTEDCVMTDHVNMLHGDMDHQVTSPCGGVGVLVGLDSQWRHFDRRWRLLECNVAGDSSSH